MVGLRLLMRVAVGAVLVGACDAPSAEAQQTVTSSFTLQSPRPGVVNPPLKTNGLQVTVNKRDWPGNAGYHQCEVTVTSAAPRSSQREITVLLEMTDSWFRWTGHRGDIAVTSVVVLPAGEVAASSTILLPEYRSWHEITLKVWDDGQELKDMTNSTYMSYQSSNDGEPAILAVGGMQNLPVLGTDGWKAVVNVGLLELPTDWLAYTSLDAAIIAEKQLTELVAKHPAQWKGLRSWVATGGNLWVYGVQNNDARRSALAELLDVDVASKSEDDTPNTVWRAVHRDQLNSRWARLGGGTVVALTAKSPEKSNLDWTLIDEAGGEGRTEWSSRHGVTFSGGNSDFWTLTIPGVGLPPIGAFQILITLFVVVIGPLNYAVLRRRHRLNMMIVTVPLSAIAISAVLIVYALVADGLSTRMKTRSLTMIDQPRGEATCWGRLSYYSGRSHSAGLTFATDTAVYPMEPDAGGRQQHATREVAWADTQRLPRGWLPARTATQLVTVRHRASEVRVDVTATEGQSPPQAVNRLGYRIQKFWLVDGEGRWFHSPSAGDGQPLTLVATDAAGFADAWKHIHDSTKLCYPSDWKGGWLTGNFFSGVAPAGSQSGDSVLEQGLLKPLDADSRRMWVAVVDDSPELQRGISGASESEGFHVIAGRW